jgi:surface antigen
MIAIASVLAAGCSMVLPFGGMSTAASPEPAVKPAIEVTGSLGSRAADKADALLADHLGPEDLRRAHGAMGLALDPQSNGSPVSWDNAESRSNGRFTPVGGPFLREFEVCRAFIAQLRTIADQRQLQGTACRPSGGEWSITDLKPWKQPGQSG